MQSNIDATMDDIYEFPDSWIELYNPTDKKISLEGYKLGTSKKADKAYNLPSQYSVWPHSHFLIYCDKGGFNRHATFRLDSGKGSVYLFYENEIIDKIDEFSAQPSPNVSFGREYDGSETWGYQLIPTPEKSNYGGISNIILGDPVFSVEGRVCTSPISLTLSIPQESPEGTVLVYTTDGSEPTIDSNVYSQPLSISKNTIVRAKLFCDGAISPISVTHSYIFHERTMTLPIVSVVTNAKYLFSDEIGIFSETVNVGELPNYEYDWRRPVNLELFESEDKNAALNQMCETRVKGNLTRSYLIKSMVFYANKRFGTKRFDYEFFPDQKPGLTDFKSFEARNAGQDCYRAYIRDALIQRMMGENADLDWQAWRPAVFYINGEYHGILNIRERSNEDNVYTNHEGLEDIDVIENWKTLKEGSIDNFEAFKKFYHEENHSYEEYDKLMDIDEFINYFITQMFFFNYDFPGNNLIMWRPQKEEGKWRWICKDLDVGLGCWKLDSWKMNYLDWLFNYNKPEYSEMIWAVNDETNMLFRRLWDIPKFKDKFIATFAVYMGDFLTDKKTIELMELMANEIKCEWPSHYEKNNPKWDNYDYFLDQIRDYVTNRYNVVYNHLSEWFLLGAPIPLIIDNKENFLEEIKVQDIKLKNNSFNGKYFSGSTIRIEGTPIQDSETDGFIIEIKYKNGKIEQSIHNSLNIDFVMLDSYDSVKFNSIKNASLIDPKLFFEGPTEVFNLNGIKIANSTENLHPGVYIVRQGSKTEKIIIK